MFSRLFITAIFFSTFVLTSCRPGEAETTQAEEPLSSISYDSALAVRLGADEYGMKYYVLAILRVGPDRQQDSVMAAQIQRAHLDNISRLVNEGKMAIAGPCLDTRAMRGIFIYNVTTVEEAKVLFESDPAVQAGRLVAEYHPWYGSAALMGVRDVHRQISKRKI